MIQFDVEETFQLKNLNKYILSIINHSLLGNKASSQMLLMFKVTHTFYQQK